jgi:hypothetical protein
MEGNWLVYCTTRLWNMYVTQLSLSNNLNSTQVYNGDLVTNFVNQGMIILLRGEF